MEQLQQVLLEYNLATAERVADVEWTQQYRSLPFPAYWRLVYELMSGRHRGSRVLEVGCGCGDITAILCYQGYNNIRAFEADQRLSSYASEKIGALFGKDGIIENCLFPEEGDYKSDILLMVNCVYAGCTQSKEEYMESILDIYRAAGLPKTALIEVVDDSFEEEHPDFPMHARLGKNDIGRLFPGCSIRSWPTYIYPRNGKSKTLYEIETA